MTRPIKCKLCIQALKNGGACPQHSVKRRGYEGKPGQGAQIAGRPRDGRAVGDARYRIWQAMRVLRRFTLSQLVATSETNYGIAKQYALLLKRAGYVRDVAAPRAYLGRDGEAVKVLTRDTGVKPPRVRQDGTVLDLNVGRGGDGAGRGISGGMG